MPDDYTKLKHNFFETFREIEADVKATEQVGGKFPLPVLAEFCSALICFGKAEEEFSKGDEKEAVEKMQEAIDHLRRASFDFLEYDSFFISEMAHTVFDEYIKRNDDLAFDYIINYREVHSKSLFGFGDIIENKELPSKDSPDYKDIYRDKIQKFLAFLSDFQASGSALVAAKKKEKRATQLQITHVCLSVVAIVIAGLSFLNNSTLGEQIEKFLDFLWWLIITQPH